MDAPWPRPTPDARLPVTIDDILAARTVLAGQVVRTPLVRAATLSERLGVDLRLKLENQQITGSFKPRGALARLAGLTEDERRRGVIAMSAGNHAQGVAYHARRLAIPATIVMPATTPFTKVEATRRHGATVVQHGSTVIDCATSGAELIQRHGYAQIHPFDDPAIIAGQGTVGLEIHEDAPELDVVLVPVGGGGLLAGVAVALKALNPAIRLFGVEAAMFPSMREALLGMAPSSGGDTLAEGIAVKTAGTMPKTIIGALAEDILLVEEPAIEHAVQVLADTQKVVAEGAGAVTLAALLTAPERFRGLKVAAVVSGGNIDSRLLASVLMRGLVRDGRMVRIRVEIPDQPGVLSRISGLLGEAGANIVEVYHQRLFQDVPVKNAELDAVIETRNADHIGEVVSTLEAAGFKTRILSALGREGPTF